MIKKNNRFILLSLIALTAILISSCASRSPRNFQTIEAATPSEEAETIEAPSREAVYIYSNQKKLAENIILRFSSEPILLPSGYARLVGVVSGGKPVACLEIGGRGLVVGKGEEIDDYRVVGIGNDSVVLERNKRNDK